VQRDGTVLSWARAAKAAAPTRYRVLRAGYVHAPLTFAAPPVQPSGFRADDQLPVLAAPGTPGAAAVDVPVMTRFSAIGTTSGSYFVDRTARPGEHYAYQVVAEGPAGTRPARSNLQVVPDPRPPATAGQVLRLAGTASARGTNANAIAAARVARMAPAGSDARVMAERLERRLRYAGIAGG
jgi:hypothetical protein